MKLSSVENTNCFYITFKCDSQSPKMLLERMAEISAEGVEPWELVGENEYPVKEKYDTNVPQRLLLEGFCKDELDVNELCGFFDSLN